MTGTWRDTLFIWQGKLTKTSNKHSNKGGDHNETSGRSIVGGEPNTSCSIPTAITWRGSWIGCENCPDARTAPTPTAEAFGASEMKFEVSGTGFSVGESRDADDDNDGDTDDAQAVVFWKLELEGGPGWDLGEGFEKRRHTDNVHTLYMKNLPSDHDNREMSVVVAMGENEFGSFISAGYLQPTSSEMILARRYLDGRDLRLKLTIEELYERVTGADHGSYCLGSYEMWSNGKARRRFSTWRTLDLHAACCLKGKSGKRKRMDEGRDSLEALPPLYIPTDGFSPDLTILATPALEDYNINNINNVHAAVVTTTANHLASHVRWLEQCNGCGQEIGDPVKACCKEVVEYTSREEPNVAVGWTFYCSEECAQRYGARAWADAGRKWASVMASCPGYFLKSNGASGFWYAVQNDRDAMSVLRDAGWRKDFMDYILDAPRKEGEPIQYDD